MKTTGFMGQNISVGSTQFRIYLKFSSDIIKSLTGLILLLRWGLTKILLLGWCRAVLNDVILRCCSMELGQHQRFYAKHCVKSVRIWSYSGPYFPSFGLNTDRNSKCGKIRTRITPNTNTFHAVKRLFFICVANISLDENFARLRHILKFVEPFRKKL